MQNTVLGGEHDDTETSASANQEASPINQLKPSLSVCNPF